MVVKATLKDRADGKSVAIMRLAGKSGIRLFQKNGERKTKSVLKNTESIITASKKGISLFPFTGFFNIV